MPDSANLTNYESLFIALSRQAQAEGRKVIPMPSYAAAVKARQKYYSFRKIAERMQMDYYRLMEGLQVRLVPATQGQPTKDKSGPWTLIVEKVNESDIAQALRAAGITEEMPDFDEPPSAPSAPEEPLKGDYDFIND